MGKDLVKANTLSEELKSKINCLEDEKSSLTTVIRIIQEDNPQRTKLNCSKNDHADEKYVEVKNKKKTRKHRKHKKTPEKPILINSVNEENQSEAQVNIQPGNQHTQTETAESIAQMARTLILLESYLNRCARIWNALPKELTGKNTNLAGFKYRIYQYYKLALETVHDVLCCVISHCY